MRLSTYFFKTIKEIPSDADLKSHRLLIRGGYIKQISAGVFSYLPIAVRSFKKIETIIREEMDLVGGNEVNLPVTMPASLWEESGRYDSVGDELLRFKDRTGRRMLLAMTHEEAVTDMVRFVINSYKQLPVMLYQLQTKFRDEPRVRGGLIRVREFIMKDAYSFHTDQADLEKYYDRVHKAYEIIFNRCGLDHVSVASDVGMMGGSGAHEFMAVAESGEDTLVMCTKCDYRANREVASSRRDYADDAKLPKEEVHTPAKKTIEEVSQFLSIKPQQTLKAVVYLMDDELVMAVIRGDLDVNETKLRNYLGARQLIMPGDAELQKAGIIPGFATPVDARVRVIVDESAARSTNLVAGANKIDYHVKNINFGRDYSSEDVVDISSVSKGETCVECDGQLNVTRGIEIGNIFKLGTKYSKSMKATFLDENGKEQKLIMGCYGIGVGRLLASTLEVRADERRIIWPISIAPFEVELIGLSLEKDEDVRNSCEQLYNNLTDAGIEVLFDDRKARPGFKFNDADLIGSPIRVTIGSKSLEKGGAEVTINDAEAVIIPLDKLKAEIIDVRTNLFNRLNQ